MASIYEQIFANSNNRCKDQRQALIEWTSFEGQQNIRYYSAAWLHCTSIAIVTTCCILERNSHSNQIDTMPSYCII